MIGRALGWDKKLCLPAGLFDASPREGALIAGAELWGGEYFIGRSSVLAAMHGAAGCRLLDDMHQSGPNGLHPPR